MKNEFVTEYSWMVQF